ncbi:dUTP diphosphatase [Bacillus sp. FJAT-22090]|uniref:dUTP diphosphatase n=1 Tax=Bacillus sp. FJAT-22090 TaxID=1581038 RepID=UPI0021B2B086|nr:deoxyuridine 5'-triphosphate nucleotidohydrolase [Bacillus sp. FJAT-22090]
MEAKKQAKKSKAPLKIKVKYFNKDITKLEKITKGDWIDLRVAETVELKAGESAVIKLGVGMKLPEGFEANVVPRSSTFKNYGIIQTNHYGVIDNSYSGNEDEWRFPVYATRDTVINFDDRVCQFRIQRKMPEVEIEEVEELDVISRGGFGSTGIK